MVLFTFVTFQILQKIRTNLKSDAKARARRCVAKAAQVDALWQPATARLTFQIPYYARVKTRDASPLAMGSIQTTWTIRRNKVTGEDWRQ